MKLTSLFTLILVTAFSVKSYSQPLPATPLDLNDIITETVTNLFKIGAEWGKKFGEIKNGNKHYSDLAPIRIKMETYIDQKTAYLKKINDINGSGDYRKAVISFLEFEKTFEVGFIQIEKLNAKSSDDEINNALQNITSRTEYEKKQLDNITALKQAYADKNHIPIVKTK